MTTFQNLHQQKNPLLIGNVWDVPSAKIAESLGFQAIGTSSAAIAKMLGYEDGEELTFSELRYIVERIKANTQLPLSVDIESGYSRDPLQIAQHIQVLEELGVVGINLEDSIVEDGQRILLPADFFANIISVVKKELDKKGSTMFFNIRTDTFILGIPDTVIATKERIRLYEQAGADGIFVPCIVQEKAIQTIVECTDLPLNVMCMPDLPNFSVLQRLGVQRISMGNFVFEKNYGLFEELMKGIRVEGSFGPVF